MDINLKSPLSRYGAAVLFAGAALAARGALVPVIGYDSPFLTLSAAVAAAAALGGVGPGLLATFLCSLTTPFLFIHPQLTLGIATQEDVVKVVVFAVTGAVISLVTGDRRRARSELREVEIKAKQQSIEAAAALRESEERSRLAESTVGVGVWEWDLAANEVDWSDGIYRLVGVDPAENKASMAAWSDLILEEDRDVALSGIQKLIEEGSPNFYGEFRIRRRSDGRVRWLATQGKIIREDGRPARLLGVNFDITETKESELKIQNLNRELNRRVRELQTIIELTPVGIAVAQDANCDVISANPTLAGMVGMQPGDNVSLNRRELPYRHLKNGRELRPSELPMQRAVAERRPIVGEEMDIERADGSRISIYCYAAPIIDDEDNVLGCIAAQIDVTEQKRYELEREQKLGEEHGLRLQAEEANRLKDEFLATISHELRTPLNSIIGWTALLKEGKTASDLHSRAVNAIERGARSQVQLIEDLLDVSRIVSGKFQIHQEPLDFRKVVLAAVETVRPSADAKGIRLDLDLEKDPITLMGDFGRLQQVVWNLLSNAIKFTPEGGRIVVQLDSMRREIELVIRDSGRGIPHDFLPFVFDRFRQADGSITRTSAGLGLGLSIVKHIVELHGGAVAVESPGENLGSSFTVRLPRKTARRDDPNGADRRESDYESDMLRLDGVSVLVIDDEADTRELLRLAFEKCGAAARTASSAAEGLELLKEGHTDVIVSDIGMSGTDGFTFIREVRSWEAASGRAQTPAIALTAYARQDDREKALTSGFQLHVPKPAEPGKIVQLVRDLVIEKVI